MYDVMFKQRANMGSCEGRYWCTRGPIWVIESWLIWIWNHKPYQPGLLSKLLLFLVKHVINGSIFIMHITSYYCSSTAFGVNILLSEGL